MKAQSALEMTLVFGVVIAIVTMIIPFAVKLYYTIHADMLMKQTLLQKLAKKSIEDNKQYRIIQVDILEPEYREVFYDVCLNEIPDGSGSPWEIQTRLEITDLIYEQTNITTFALGISQAPC